MSILEELNNLIEALDIPVETGAFSNTPPDTYVVLTPIIDSFDCFADNKPLYDIQEVRLSLFAKSNYLNIRNRITSALLSADFTVTERRYIGREDNTGYHHYAIDVAKEYDQREE